MTSIFRLRAITGFCVGGFLLACVLSQSQTASLGEMAGRSVEMRLVKADDLSPVPTPPEALTLTAVPVRMTKQDTLYTILQANGVVPDTEAFCLVYDLNPTLNDIKELKVDSLVQVPKVGSSQELASKLGKDYLVAVTVDPEIRQALNQGVDELQAAAPRFAQSPDSRFESPADSGSTKQEVATLAKWYSEIKKSFLRRTGPPLRRQTLLQLKNEVDVLNSLIAERPGSAPKLTKSDQEQIAAIYQDLESEIMKYGQVLANQAPPAEALYRVVINIKGDNLSQIDRLRVYYTINGVYRDPPSNPPVISYPFRQLGSGRFEVLPVKSYKVWAALDGDPGHPLTPPLVVRVSPLAGDKQEFDLSLTKGQHQ
jgi:hypothetical protein